MSRPTAAADLTLESRPVWDVFVRVFHWTLVACVLTNGLVLDDGEDIHQWLGYLASALVLTRGVWGFVGSTHARFADFWPTPTRVMAHVRAALTGRPQHHWGHNPLGALMMLWLMALVLMLGLTGWMQGLDTFWGEEWLQDLHEISGEVLLLSAGLHAAAALVMGRLERTRLLKAMVTGVKERW
jgi:cytochrome b